jgi:hypothetical protein
VVAVSATSYGPVLLLPFFSEFTDFHVLPSVLAWSALFWFSWEKARYDKARSCQSHLKIVIYQLYVWALYDYDFILPGLRGFFFLDIDPQ